MGGVLYGVSVGPGDPELLTIKAIKAIEACRVIATPVTTGAKTLALDIAKSAVSLQGKEILIFPFIMTRDKDVLAQNHLEVSNKIKARLDMGEDVAFLNLGDISVFSTFAYIMDILSQDGYTVKMIPGVTSFCAVASALGTGLTSMNKPLHIIPSGSGLPVDKALDLDGTKVLMKAGKAMAQVKATIIAKGLKDKAKLVQNCGLPNEILCEDISTASDDASYFTTIIIKE